MANVDLYIVQRDKCPICGLDHLRSVYKRPYESERMQDYLDLAYDGRMELSYLQGVEFEIAECVDCGFLFQTSVLTHMGAKRLYDVWIDPTLTERRESKRDVNKALEFCILNFVERYLRCAEIKMLDYGAGFGRFCLLAKALGFDVTAVEISKERSRVLDERGIEAIEPKGGGRDKYYHFINMSQVLEHVTDPMAALHRVHDELREDGLVSISVPNCRRLKRVLRSADALSIPQFQKALLDCSALQHVNSFTRATLHYACERAGLSIVFRPLLFIGCGIIGTGPRELLKNIVRPFYYRMRTCFFLKRKR